MEEKKQKMLQKCMKNRELSWLEFNQRILEEAKCADNLLFERFFFLSIFTSNLDEFYMVRVGSLTDYILQAPGYQDDKTGQTTEQQLMAVFQATIPLYAERDEIFLQIETQLNQEGFNRISYDALSEEEQEQLDDHFDNFIYPILSPQVVGKKHPFPHLDNKAIVIVVTLASKDKKTFGLIPLPKALDRCYYLPGVIGRYILLEDIIKHYAEKIFYNFKVVDTTAISVTRNADLAMTDHYFHEDDDFWKHMSMLLK